MGYERLRLTGGFTGGLQMLKVYTGENRCLSAELIARVGEAMAQCDADLFIIVPRQLTLLTERTLIREMHLRGSFRLRVMSPARLCGLIFQAAGAPGGVRVDDRGRVMLVRAALRDVQDQLTIYKNARRRRGFAERCAKQLETLAQGLVTSDDLRACAEEETGADRLRLLDLAAVMDAVNARMQDRYQDGDTELIAAAARAESAAFIEGARFFFYGFDMMPHTLIQLVGRIAARADAQLFFPLKNDAEARDYLCYQGAEQALGRIFAQCGGTRVRVNAPDARQADVSALTDEIYAVRKRAFRGAPRHVRALMAQDVRQECMQAAATARRLAMRGMRWSDMQLIVADLESYRQTLIEAFRLYDVPLFLGSSRAVSRTATAECLIAALRICDGGWRTEDVFTLLRTGYVDATPDEVDRLCNYAVRRGIDRARWTRPFTRGDNAEIEAMEEIRRRIAEPVLQLKARLARAQDLRGQLAAAFEYLECVRAYERSQDLQRDLTDRGMYEAAGELSQAWNGIIGAMDQLSDLMGGARMAISELAQTLTEALEAAAIKPLPQSGDAVFAQSAGRMLMQSAKCVFLMGLADRGGAADDGLINGGLQRRVAARTRAYLGPDPREAALMRRFYVKSALGMATDYVVLSCPLSGTDGAAQRPDAIFSEFRAIFPDAAIDGGVRQDEAALRRMLCAPAAAESLLAGAVSRARDGEAPNETELTAAGTLRRMAERMPDLRGKLARMLGAQNEYAPIGAQAARALYGRIQQISVTRLEGFAKCPFSHFIKYGLRPDRVQPFEMNRQQVGTFLHAAISEFLRRYGEQLNEMPASEADARMGEIADRMVRDMRAGSPMEDSAAARAEGRSMCAIARRSARVLAEQMRGSRFRAEFTEQDFGREDKNGLRAGDVALEGRIDRADRWTDGGAVRIVDFKLGGKKINLAAMYHGLQLQLPVYLGAAMRRWNTRSAGMYYFPLSEGIVNTQSTDADTVEAERNHDLRMQGVLPRDEELMQAQTPEPARVFQARFSKDGRLYANELCADELDFKRLVRHAQKRASEEIQRIRSGESQVSPVLFGTMNPCTYCDERDSCLFDPRSDAKKVRRMPSMKWAEVFEKIALEDEE